MKWEYCLGLSLLLFAYFYSIGFPILRELYEIRKERKQMELKSENPNIQLKINQLINQYGKEAVLRELEYCIKHEGNVRVSVKEMRYKRG